MQWYKQYTVTDTPMSILFLKKMHIERSVLLEIRCIYVAQNGDISKEILLLMLPDYLTEIETLKKLKFIEFTSGKGKSKLKIPSFRTNFQKVREGEVIKHTPPLNTSNRQDKTRKEETRQEQKRGKNQPTDSTFSTYSECYKWAIKTFKTHTGNQLLFDQHLGKIFNTYKKQKWIDENGCTIANKKGIIIRAMQNKDWHTKSKV